MVLAIMVLRSRGLKAPFSEAAAMTRLLILPGIFAAATLSLWYMIRSAPGWSSPGMSARPRITHCNENPIFLKQLVYPDGTVSFELPAQFDNFTVLAEKFRDYKDEHYAYITTVFVCTYLYKQTFAIPGSFLLVSFD